MLFDTRATGAAGPSRVPCRRLGPVRHRTVTPSSPRHARGIERRFGRQRVDISKHPTGHPSGAACARVSYANPADPLPRRLLIRAVELATGQHKLNTLYRDYRRRDGAGEAIWDAAFRRLRLRLCLDQTALDAVPRQGPLVIVANHPFGILDGLAACRIAASLRSEFKLLAHSTLSQAPETHSFILPIDFTGSKDGVRRNVDSRRAALRCLAAGGAVVIFPAGRVSTATTPYGRATDSEWKPFAARLIVEARAAVLPVFFEGQNAWSFHVVSRFSEALREALLLHEVVRRIGGEIRARIGQPIAYDEIAHIPDRRHLIAYLRLRTYALDPGRPAPSKWRSIMLWLARRNAPPLVRGPRDDDREWASQPSEPESRPEGRKVMPQRPRAA